MDSINMVTKDDQSYVTSKDLGKPRWLPCLMIGAAYWTTFLPLQMLVDNQYLDLISFPASLLVSSILFFLFVISWIGFSQRSWGERLSGLVTFLGVAVLTVLAADQTMGLGLALQGLPTALFAWGVWGFVTRKQPSLNRRRVTLLITMLATSAYFCMLRFDGITGGSQAQFSWRWSPTSEQRFLEMKKYGTTRTIETVQGFKNESDSQLTIQAGDWPGFRGPNRDSVVHGVRLETDWNKHPPEIVWQQPIGPGWSSFAVVDSRLFTQEQRGDFECVTCYDSKTGAEIWCHQNETRHSDPMAGSGPRGTPQFASGKLFAQGATGDLVCIDSATGQEVWKVTIASDPLVAKKTDNGFSGSPLVVADVVITIPGSSDSGSVVAYRVSDGSIVWKMGKGFSGYVSAHEVELFGKRQVLVLTNTGAVSVEASSGNIVWEYSWPFNNELPISQPQVVDGSKIVFPAGRDEGTRLVDVKRDGDKWSVQELWKTNRFLPYFSDFVVQDGHAFGVDGSVFSCFNLNTGERCWKKGRYGNGQILLLAEQKLILVLSDSGEVVLIEANKTVHKELARFSVLSGKTWNHPVLVRDRLFVRNGEQVACLKIPLMEKQVVASSH